MTLRQERALDWAVDRKAGVLLRRCERIPIRARHGVPLHEFSVGYISRSRALSNFSPLLSLGKEFATGNQAVTATNEDYDPHTMDIEKTLGIDIPSGDTESAEL